MPHHLSVYNEDRLLRGETVSFCTLDPGKEGPVSLTIEHNLAPEFLNLRQSTLKQMSSPQLLRKFIQDCPIDLILTNYRIILVPRIEGQSQWLRLLQERFDTYSFLKEFFVVPLG